MCKYRCVGCKCLQPEDRVAGVIKVDLYKSTGYQKWRPGGN